MNSTSVTLCRLMLFDVKTIKSQIWGYQQENKIRSRGLTTIVIIVHIALRCYKKTQTYRLVLEVNNVGDIGIHDRHNATLSDQLQQPCLPYGHV